MLFLELQFACVAYACDDEPVNLATLGDFVIFFKYVRQDLFETLVLLI